MSEVEKVEAKLKKLEEEDSMTIQQRLRMLDRKHTHHELKKGPEFDPQASQFPNNVFLFPEVDFSQMSAFNEALDQAHAQQAAA